MFTATELIAKVKELVKASPENRYEANPCRYCTGKNTNGSVGCLFGQALRALGMPNEQLIKFDMNLHNLIGEMLPTIGIECNESERKWLTIVQRYQDQHFAWDKYFD